MKRPEEKRPNRRREGEGQGAGRRGRRRTRRIVHKSGRRRQQGEGQEEREETTEKDRGPRRRRLRKRGDDREREQTTEIDCGHEAIKSGRRFLRKMMDRRPAREGEDDLTASSRKSFLSFTLGSMKEGNGSPALRADQTRDQPD